MKTLLLAVALALTSCATAQVYLPPQQSASLERTLVGENRFLRLSFYATPFFGDSTKRLLTAVPPEQVRLLENPDGTPVNPGASTAVFPAGTAVRIRKVEFPSPAVMTERVLYTPRSLAWVYLDVAGTERSAPPYVLVLRPGLKDEAEFRAELDRLISREDQTPRLDAFSEMVREAVKTKKAVVDMPAEALEMAWGYPELRRIELEGDKKKETWTWADGKRVAVLVDGRTTDVR